MFDIILNEQTPNTPAIEDVSKFIETHKEQIESFKKYAISRRDGIGLAANQCSFNDERFNLRMVAVKSVEDNNCRIAIDPKITKYYGIKLQRFEGCLTWKNLPVQTGNKTVVADRYYYVDVEFYTPDGVFHQETHKGFQAQVWQHECNHINGVEETIVVFHNQPATQKIGRNDKCLCGSGKKLKQCCIEDYEDWNK
jgi:peptide deformylase